MTKTKIKIVNMLFWFIIMFLTGCAAKMVVTPTIITNDNLSNFKIEGKIEYDGNKEYLPRTINYDSAPDTIFCLKYSYDVTYGRDNTPQAIPLFNPLTIIGFPIGENTLVVKGKLLLLKGKEVLKEYSATCGLEKTRSLFSEGETFSELRKKGLIAVRDNIEMQMYQDREFLSKLKE